MGRWKDRRKFENNPFLCQLLLCLLATSDFYSRIEGFGVLKD